MKIQLSAFIGKTLEEIQQFYVTIPQTESELEIELNTPKTLNLPIQALPYLPRHVTAITFSGKYRILTPEYRYRTGTRTQAGGGGEVSIYSIGSHRICDVMSILKPFVEALPSSVFSLKLAFSLSDNHIFGLDGSSVSRSLAEIVKLIPATVTQLDMTQLQLGWCERGWQATLLQSIPATVTDFHIGWLGLQQPHVRRAMLSVIGRGVVSFTLMDSYLSQAEATSWPQFFQGLPNGLRIVSLANNALGQKNPTELRGMLSGLPANLLTLKLNGNNLAHLSGEQLADVLSGLPETIEELDLGENGLLLMAVDELALALAGLRPQTNRLRLSERNVTTLQLDALIQRLQVIPAHIDTLDFSDCNLFGLSVDEFCLLLEAIPQTVTTLSLSNIVKNLRYHDEWSQLLASVPSHITSVLLENNNLGCLDAAGLREVFAGCPTHIKRLGLSHNKFNTLMVSQLEPRLSGLPDVILDFSNDNPHQQRIPAPSLSLTTNQHGLFKTHFVAKKQQQFASHMLVLMQLMDAQPVLGINITNYILSFILNDVSRPMLQRLRTRIIAETRPEIVTSEVLDLTIRTVNKRFEVAETTQATVMDLSRCGLNRIDSIDLLRRVFKAVPEEISAVNLTGNGFSKKKKTLALFIKGLRDIPDHISHLDLSHNGFELFNGEQLQALFVNLPATVLTITLGEGKPLSLSTHIGIHYWPGAYETLLTPSIDLLQQARALLDDYTKGDSWLWRMLYLHWARHHVEEVVRLVMRIDHGLITNAKDLLGELDLIEPVNQVGSLNRRISFLNSKSLQANALGRPRPLLNGAEVALGVADEVEMTTLSHV